MIKWESKLIGFLERHMVLLAALVVSGVAFLMRRQSIWFYTEDYTYYFDMHSQNIQSALYYLLVRMTGYVFEIPLHGVKWLAGMADFVVAVLCVMLCGSAYGRSDRKDTVEKVRFLLLYAACLFVPVVYLRGSVWAQIDSLALAFLLGAACVWENYEKKGLMAAVVLAALGVALYPPFVLVAAWYCLYVKRAEGACAKYVWLPVIGVAILVEMLSGLAIGIGWKQSALTLVNWLTYHPHTGILYETLGEWMWQQLLLFSCGVALISLIAVFRRKMPLFVGITVELVLAICYGMALGW